MTINEIEARTGLERATVRYYESVGLIRPGREPNGYRNYSGSDLEKLLKIKLLRALDFSVEDIRAMDADAADFSERLRARRRSMEAKEADIEDAKRVLELMLDRGARYEDLETGFYLSALSAEQTALPAPAPAEPGDASEYAGPWARFFARVLDCALLEIVYLFVTTNLMSIPYALSGWGAVLRTVILITATLLLEPILLWTLGATPGKLVLGLYVADRRGHELSLGEAYMRTWGVLIWGEGLRIPLIALWRRVKSYKDARAGLELPWEEGSAVLVRDGRTWRRYLCAGCFAACLALTVLVSGLSLLPANRGNLTPAELAENVNRYFHFNLETDTGWELNPDGTWRDTRASEYGAVYADFFGADFEPEAVTLTVENGYVAGLVWSQTVELTFGAGPVTALSRYVRALTFSLAGADVSQGFSALVSLEKLASLEDFEGFAIEYGSFRVTCSTDSALSAGGKRMYSVELIITKK